MNTPCLKSELSLFDLPLTQVVMERSLWIDVYPVVSLDGNSPIEFSFSSGQDEYLDLNDTVLYVKLKVTKTDGTNLDAASVATPGNLTLASLFSDIHLSMNETMLDGGHYLYPYKAMMTSLLQFDDGMKSTQLEAAGYNETEVTRTVRISVTKDREFLGFHLDVLFQSRQV